MCCAVFTFYRETRPSVSPFARSVRLFRVFFYFINLVRSAFTPTDRKTHALSTLVFPHLRRVNNWCSFSGRCRSPFLLSRCFCFAHISPLRPLVMSAPTHSSAPSSVDRLVNAIISSPPPPPPPVWIEISMRSFERKPRLQNRPELRETPGPGEELRLGGYDPGMQVRVKFCWGCKSAGLDGFLVAVGWMLKISNQLSVSLSLYKTHSEPQTEQYRPVKSQTQISQMAARNC